jgi:hypothetical protein
MFSRVLCAFLLSSTHDTHPVHLTVLDLITLIIFGESRPKNVGVPHNRVTSHSRPTQTGPLIYDKVPQFSFFAIYFISLLACGPPANICAKL